MRVLIAHGSSEVRAALADAVIREAGVSPEIVETLAGAETLDLLLTDDPPEVALVDWDLPGIEGPELCRLIRDFHHGSDTHLVILCSPTHGGAAEASRAGAADCIPAPPSPDAVGAAVRNGFERAAAWRMARYPHHPETGGGVPSEVVIGEL